MTGWEADEARTYAHANPDPEPAVIIPALWATSDCPECRAGKHANCDGAAWNTNTDSPGLCPCWMKGHENP